MPATTHADPIAPGQWSVDPAHSIAGFEVEHAGLSVFRGRFRDVEARLVSSEAGLSLSGAVAVESIDVDDENIRPHLLSPEFFDVERHPQVRFESTELAIDGDEVRLAGELEIAGQSRTVEARGRLRGPVPAPGGGEKLALALESAIDRTAFGMDWQMEMPGGQAALANEVKLLVELELASG